MSRDERIAARLIAAINSLIPVWCTASFHHDWLEVAIDGNAEVAVYLAVAQGERDREAVVAFNVLSTIQDAIVRTSTQPWPPASEPTYLPYPAAAVRQGQLVAWYGPEAQPTVAIPPIDLATA